MYVGSGPDGLFAVSPSDGSVQWQFAPDERMHVETPVLENGTVYFVSSPRQHGESTHLIAVDTRSRFEQWRVEVPWGTVTDVHNGIVFFVDEGELRAYEATDGDWRWNVTIDLEYVSGTLVGDGYRYMSVGTATATTGSWP